MAGFDTTNVAATVGQNQPNLLQTAEQFAATQNMFNQNRLFQAQRLAGQASQAAIGPDGQYDPTKANQFLAGAGPNAALAVPAALANNQTYATGAQTLAEARYGALRTTLGPLMTAPNIQPTDVVSAIGLLAKSGVVSPDMAATVAGSLPSDPKAMRQYLADNFGLPNLGPTAALNATTPAPQMTDVGNVIAPVTAPPQIGTGTFAGPAGPGGVPAIAPATGAPTVAPGVVKTLTPSEEAAPRTVVGPTGAAVQVPTSAIISPTGQAVPNVPGLTGPHGETGAGIGPATAAAASQTGAGNAQQALALQSRAGDVPTRKATLSNMSQEATQFASGPQSGFWKGLGQLAAEYHIGAPTPVPSNDAAASQEEFDKLSVGVLGAQRAAAGLPQTDASTQIASGATPNERMTPKGIQRVIGVMQGNEDYIAAQDSAYQKWQAAGHGAETFGQFQQQFNRMFDPRVFQAQYATPDQTAVIVKSVGPQTFERQWTALHRLGWLGAPSGQ